MKKSRKSNVKNRPRRAPLAKNTARYPANRPAYSKHRSSAQYMKRRKNLTSRPDIRVKKESYSKAVRGTVLANAVARQSLIEMGGENTIDVIREFDRDMSDEELAKKTGIKASDVRVVLNRLHSQGLFSYTRVRDRDSGWYSYIWKMSEGKLKDFGEKFAPGMEGEKTEIMEGDAYICPQCSPGAPVKFEDAAELKFKCSNCGSDLEFLERNKPRGPAQP